MVKFTFAPLALLALAATAMAQESSSSSATSSASTASPTSMSSASSSASAGAGQSGVCAVLVGDPRYPPHGCPYSSTSTPPYDLNSLMSYLIGGYTAKKEGVHITDVADDLAGSVTKYYPTMTTPKSVIAQSFAAAISASVQGVRDGTINLNPDSDSAQYNVPSAVLSVSIAAIAAVAGGAFLL